MLALQQRLNALEDQRVGLACGQAMADLQALGADAQAGADAVAAADLIARADQILQGTRWALRRPAGDPRTRRDTGKLQRRRTDAVPPLPVVITPPAPRPPQLEGRLCLRLPQAQLQQLETIAAAHRVPRCDAARDLLAQALAALDHAA